MGGLRRVWLKHSLLLDYDKGAGTTPNRWLLGEPTSRALDNRRCYLAHHHKGGNAIAGAVSFPAMVRVAARNTKIGSGGPYGLMVDIPHGVVDPP